MCTTEAQLRAKREEGIVINRVEKGSFIVPLRYLFCFQPVGMTDGLRDGGAKVMVYTHEQAASVVQMG